MVRSLKLISKLYILNTELNCTYLHGHFCLIKTDIKYDILWDYLISIITVVHFLKLIREHPFNLKGGGAMGFFSESKYFVSLHSAAEKKIATICREIIFFL